MKLKRWHVVFFVLVLTAATAMPSLGCTITRGVVSAIKAVSGERVAGLACDVTKNGDGGTVNCPPVERAKRCKAEAGACLRGLGTVAKAVWKAAAAVVGSVGRLAVQSALALAIGVGRAVVGS